MSKGTFDQAARIFMREARRFGPSMSGSVPVSQARAKHREFLTTVDRCLRKIGWTLREYQGSVSRTRKSQGRSGSGARNVG